jgi:hypothetical protein
VHNLFFNKKEKYLIENGKDIVKYLIEKGVV